MSSRNLGAALVAAVVLVCALFAIRQRAQHAQNASLAQREAPGRSPGAGAAGAAGGPRHPQPLRMAAATTRADERAAGGSIGGRVASSLDGRPIAKASLTFLHGGVAVSVQSDANGRFALTAAAPGAYELTAAEAEGYQAFEPALGHSPVTLWARAGVHVADATVYLAPIQTLTVTVVDDKSQPLAGADVRTFAYRRGWASAPAALTDAKGEARVQARPNDSIDARHAGFRSQRSYIGPSVLQSKRMTLKLTPGQDAPKLTIAGRVVDQRGQPVDGALVGATPGPHDPNAEPTGAETLSNGDGSFVLPELDAGRYRLSASARGLGASALAEVEAGARDVELRLGSPAAGLRGQVRDGAGKPIAAFTVVAWPRIGRIGRGPETRASVVDPDGRYSLTLAAGSYVVRAAASEFAASDERDVTIASDGVDADFTLGKGGRIFGKVLDRKSGDAIAGAHVQLEGDALGDGITLSSETLAGADGSFAIDGLAPGLHALQVDADLHDGRIVSGLRVPSDGTPVGPLSIDLLPIPPGQEPKVELVGIAAVLGMQPDGILIREVMPGGGAALAGIVPGDVILAVDGTGVEQMGFGDAVQLIRGPEGTVVVLTVKRGQDTVTIPVTRKKLGG